jgi:hypothetical protein
MGTRCSTHGSNEEKIGREKSLKVRHRFGDLCVDGRLMLSRFMGMIIDGVWIREWIYWPLIHTTRNNKQLQRYCWSTNFTDNHSTRLAFLQPVVFSSRSLTTGSNNGDSPTSCAQVLSSEPLCQLNCQLKYSAISSQSPLQNSTLSWLGRPNCLQDGPRRKHNPAIVVEAFTTPLHSNGRGEYHIENNPLRRVVILLHVYSLPRERVYRAVAQQRSIRHNTKVDSNETGCEVADSIHPGEVQILAGHICGRGIEPSGLHTGQDLLRTYADGQPRHHSNYTHTHRGTNHNNENHSNSNMHV